MGKVPQQTVIVMTAAAATIVMWISTVAMAMIPQAAYAQQDEVNPSPLSLDVDDCASDEHSARIDGKIKCIGEGECESYEFEGKEVKHCDY